VGRGRERNGTYAWVQGLHEVNLLAHVPACSASTRHNQDIDIGLLIVTLGLRHSMAIVTPRKVILKCSSRHNLLPETTFHHGSRDWFQGLAEDGEVRGGGVAVEHEERVEDVHWAEDIEGLEVVEYHYSVVDGEGGGVGEVWLYWCGESGWEGREEREEVWVAHVGRRVR
jgi:hypothetical protein